MSPAFSARILSPTGFPRVSGDEPTYGERTAYERMFSPRERG